MRVRRSRPVALQVGPGQTGAAIAAVAAVAAKCNELMADLCIRVEQ